MKQIFVFAILLTARSLYAADIVGLEGRADKLSGRVVDPSGRADPTARYKVLTFNPLDYCLWTAVSTNGEFSVTLEPEQLQSGNTFINVRDRDRDLAAFERILAGTTNMVINLKPAVTLSGRVEDPDRKPVAQAQVNVEFNGGDCWPLMDEPFVVTDIQGRYIIKFLPADTGCFVSASKKGYGRAHYAGSTSSTTNREDLPNLVIKPANRIVAGLVVNENWKPLAGVRVWAGGDNQPLASAITDDYGRFQLKICEGEIQLNATGQNRRTASTTTKAGETNVIITIRPPLPRLRPPAQPRKDILL